MAKNLLLAIDPGVCTGWALFARDGSLVDCSVGTPPIGSHFVVIEKPQVYRGRHSKGDPNDLITLAIQVGRYVQIQEQSGSRVALALPHTWKGTIDKKIHHARILRDLPPACRDRVNVRALAVSKSKVHNMLDAVGLGRWAFTQSNLF